MFWESQESKLQMFPLVSGPPCCTPSDRLQHGVTTLNTINNFQWYPLLNILSSEHCTSRNFGALFIFYSSTICLFLDSICWTAWQLSWFAWLENHQLKDFKINRHSWIWAKFGNSIFWFLLGEKNSEKQLTHFRWL